MSKENITSEYGQIHTVRQGSIPNYVPKIDGALIHNLRYTV